MAERPQTARIREILLDNGLVRGEIAVNSATRSGHAYRTAVVLHGDEARHIAAEMREEITAGLAAAGYRPCNWTDTIIWIERAAVADARNEAEGDPN